LIQTAGNVAELVAKAKDIVFDESVQKAIKEFILIVEEKNMIAKAKGEAFLSGNEKKKAVVSRISEWVSNLTGSVEKAVDFIDTNKLKIDTIIEEYVSFSNKMEGKATLSEAEKIIREQLYK
jgi:hypothetical protein